MEQIRTHVTTSGAAPGLAALIHPYSVDAFLAAKWPGEPLVIHGPPERHGPLQTIPELGSLDALLAVWGSLVQVFAVKPEIGPITPAVTCAVAARLYREGFHLILHPAEDYVPALAPWVDALATDLGLSPNALAAVLVYATPKGAGTPPHFDASASLVVQLRGEKSWRVARNRHVQNPHFRYSTLSPVPPELRAYAGAELPRAMPDDAESVVLEPGSVLFLPRGFWHDTRATEDAFAINFTFAQIDWASLVAIAVARLLRQHVEWRALADGVGSPDPERRHRARARLAELLATMDAHLGSLDADAVLTDIPPPRPDPFAGLDLSYDWVADLTATWRS